MIEQMTSDTPRILAFKLSEQLCDADYEKFVPTVDAAVHAVGKVNMLVQFEPGFRGWDTRALWDDIKFTTTHYSAFERIAVIGDRQWEHWMATLCKPFTEADVRYFDATESAEAWAWMRDAA